MRRLFLGTVTTAFLMIAPLDAAAQVSISVNIGLPPPIAFVAPPEVIVVPDTDDVYVVPDIDIDLFFWNGWWWRSWEDRWYRSRYYDRNWVYYRRVPRFYHDVDPSWRAYYRDGHWRGFRWEYERVPDKRLRQNWTSWRNSGYWQRQRTWDVKAYRPLPVRQRQDLRNWRQEQEREQRRQQQGPPWIQQPRQQPRDQRPPQVQRDAQPRMQEPRRQIKPRQRQEQGTRVQPPQHSRPQGEPQGVGEGYRR